MLLIIGEFNRIWEIISQLTKVIDEGNKRIDRLEETTREEFNKVWQSIDRLERAIEEMRRSNEEEFKRIWSAIQELKETVKGLIKETMKKLEALSDNFGYLKIGDEEFILIGETKTRLSRKEIEKFISKCNKIEGKQFRILISYILEPQFEVEL